MFFGVQIFDFRVFFFRHSCGFFRTLFRVKLPISNPRIPPPLPPPPGFPPPVPDGWVVGRLGISLSHRADRRIVWQIWWRYRPGELCSSHVWNSGGLKAAALGDMSSMPIRLFIRGAWREFLGPFKTQRFVEIEMVLIEDFATELCSYWYMSRWKDKPSPQGQCRSSNAIRTSVLVGQKTFGFDIYILSRVNF